MKVLIIGGTGVISTEVSALAANKGMCVYLLNRGSRMHFAPPSANTIIADIRDAKQVAALIENLHFDVVVDFVSYNPEQMISTLNLIQNKCEQYIFISTAAVYNRSGVVCRENEVPTDNLAWNYSRDKIGCEMALKVYADNYGIRYTIVRPAVTYGNTRIPYALIPKSHWSLPNRMLEGKRIVMWDDGEALCTITHSKDFAKGFISLFGNEKAYGEIFNISSDEVLSWKDIVLTIGSILNVDVDICFIPSKDIVRAMPHVAYGNTFGVLLCDKATNYILDNKKIRGIAPGFKCSISFRDGIRQTLDFYRSHPDYMSSDSLWDAQMDILISEFSK